MPTGFNTLEQAVYNVVRQEGPAPIDSDTLVRRLRSFKETDVLYAMWSLLEREVLEFTDERKIRVADR